MANVKLEGNIQLEEAMSQDVASLVAEHDYHEIVPYPQNFVQVGSAEDSEAVQYIVIQQDEDEDDVEIPTEMISLPPDQVIKREGRLPPPYVFDDNLPGTDPDDMLKSYYTTHSNSLGDTWYICKQCPTFKTSHNSSMRDHINSLHMKVQLRCTHCEFDTFRFKTLNCHRKQAHGVGALACWFTRCNFKTIVADRMLFHVTKKHELSQEYGRQLIDNLIASQPTKNKVKMARKGGGKQSSGGKEAKGDAKTGKLVSVVGQKSKLPHGQRKTDEERQYKSIFGDDGKQAYVQCLYCEFTTKLSSNMPGHVNAKHLGRQLKCEECSFSTFYPKNLAVHLKKLHHRETRRCAVPGCKFRSIEDARMNQHLVEKHGGMFDDSKNAIFVNI